MEIKEIKSTNSRPQYPTISFFVENPQLLTKSIPNSWSKNLLITGALTVFVLSGDFSKSRSNDNTHNASLAIFSNKDNKSNKDSSKETKNQKSVSIAPIFAHGKGTGAVGCIVTSPPVFISENEARQIIFDAFKAENIELDSVDCPEIIFEAPPIASDGFYSGDTNLNNAKVKLKMDGYSKKYNLTIQYVSCEDFIKFRGKSKDGMESFSSVQVYDPKKAAEIIRDELIKENKYNSGVFYDPLTKYDVENYDDWENAEKSGKENAKKQILAQVEDFIKCLKKEGIVK